MHTNKHNNLLVVVALASSRLLSSTLYRTLLFSLASTTRYRFDDICVFDVYDISIVRSMHRWVDLLIKKKQIDICSTFKKRTHDALVTLKVTRRYIFYLCSSLYWRFVNVCLFINAIDEELMLFWSSQRKRFSRMRRVLILRTFERKCALCYVSSTFETRRTTSLAIKRVFWLIFMSILIVFAIFNRASWMFNELILDWSLWFA